MKKLIYQAYIGNRSRLYDHCTKSVKAYADRIGADYKLQRLPILRIKPDLFRTDRTGKAGGWAKIGYMPIFEKENVFDEFDNYDMCCVIDSDIYIREDAPDVFKELDDEAVGSVYECDLPMTTEYANKIRGYSSSIVKGLKMDWESNSETGYDFFNSGVMLYDSKKMKEVLNGMGPREFLEQPMLKDFIDGVGPLRWQSDQMTLNYWFKKKKVKVKRMDWKWNALFSAVRNDRIKDGYFVHFFLKDLLPDKGENIKELMEKI